MGAGLSRNKAAKFAKGKYIAFLDSDDVWKRNKLKHQLAFMKKRKIDAWLTSFHDKGSFNASRKTIGSTLPPEVMTTVV